MNRQRRGQRIALTDSERDEFLSSARTCRVATIGIDGPHVSPLWFVWEDQAIWLYTILASQRFRDLERDSRLSVVVDDGVEFNELRGVEIRGTAEIIGEVPRVGYDNMQLVRIEESFAKKYKRTDSLAYDGRHAWMRVNASKIVSWDFRKLPRK